MTSSQRFLTSLLTIVLLATTMVSAGLPDPGMTIDPVSGLIDWMPGAAGDFDVEVEAANAVGNDTQLFTVTVGEAEACPADISAYWKLNDDPGPPFTDWVGTADGDCATCPDPAAGLIGGAQWFDGTDEVNVANSSVFDAEPPDCSIAYWMVNLCREHRF